MSSGIKPVADRYAVLFLLFTNKSRSSSSSANSAGRIIGTVTDTQGAAIAGAQITVVNTGTAITQKTTSNGQGFYQVLELPVGTYTISAEHGGFAKEVTPAQSLDINQSLRVDLHMQVGSVSETVVTDATATQVETVNPTIGGTVTGAPIQNLR